jgi:hypothetical protein
VLAASAGSLAAPPHAQRSNTRVNYEDENYNVGLPVFIIHGAQRESGSSSRVCSRPPPPTGNHDEPAGTDNLSAVDILAACNLVNYYGKLVRDNAPRFSLLLTSNMQGMSGTGAGKVSIAPVLLQKVLPFAIGFAFACRSLSPDARRRSLFLRATRGWRSTVWATCATRACTA